MDQARRKKNALAGMLWSDCRGGPYRGETDPTQQVAFRDTESDIEKSWTRRNARGRAREHARGRRGADPNL